MWLILLRIVGSLLFIVLGLLCVGQRLQIADLELRLREALIKLSGSEIERKSLANSLRIKGLECDKLERENKRLRKKV